MSLQLPNCYSSAGIPRYVYGVSLKSGISELASFSRGGAPCAQLFVNKLFVTRRNYNNSKSKFDDIARGLDATQTRLPSVAARETCGRGGMEDGKRLKRTAGIGSA